MKRFRTGLILAFLILLASTGSAPLSAQETPPAADTIQQIEAIATNFYRNPRDEYVRRIIAWLETDEFEKHTTAGIPLVGLLAETFRRNPDRINDWIAGDRSPRAFAVILHSLWLSGNRDLVEYYLGKFDWTPDFVEWLRRQPHSLLDIPVTTSDDLDYLWGAFFASGDVIFVDRIATAITRAAHNPNIDVDDVVYAEMFPNQKSKRSDAIVQRYYRAGSDETRRDFVLAMTALWSITGNAAHHAIIAAHFDGLARDKPDDPATNAITRAIFQQKPGTRLIQVTDGPDYQVLFSAAKGDTATVTDIVRSGEFDRFSNTFKAGRPVTLAVWLKKRPATAAAHYTLDLTAPSGKTSHFESGAIAPPDSKGTTLTATQLKPEDVMERGVYTVLLTLTVGANETTVTNKILVY